MKIQQIMCISQTLPFYQETELLSLYRSGFESSNLGHIHRLFPFSAIALTFGLKSCVCGRKSFFSPEGKIALMLLKHYSGLSDSKLIEQLNGNIYYQLFCGIFIRPGAEILDSKLVSKIRCELSRKLDMDQFQKVLSSAWKPLLKYTGVAMSDATCYESHVRFPTNEKLLWECIEWTYKQIIVHSGNLKVRRPGSKYDEIHKRYLNFSRSRKKTQKKKKKLRTSLIYLLGKLIYQLDRLECEYCQVLYACRVLIIKGVISLERSLTNKPGCRIRANLFPGES